MHTAHTSREMKRRRFGVFHAHTSANKNSIVWVKKSLRLTKPSMEREYVCWSRGLKGAKRPKQTTWRVRTAASPLCVLGCEREPSLGNKKQYRHYAGSQKTSLGVARTERRAKIEKNNLSSSIERICSSDCVRCSVPCWCCSASKSNARSFSCVCTEVRHKKQRNIKVSRRGHLHIAALLPISVCHVFVGHGSYLHFCVHSDPLSVCCNSSRPECGPKARACSPLSCLLLSPSSPLSKFETPPTEA